MEVIEAILTRRSIRKYEKKNVILNDVKEIIKAGMYAPSAGNEQPWQFIIITQKELLNKITEVHPYSGMLKEAQVAVLVCGDLEKEKHKGFWVQDCSACTQNILLAAHGKGLAAVWLGLHPLEERVNGIKELFQLPRSIIPFSVIPIGYTLNKPGCENRYSEKIIHINQW